MPQRPWLTYARWFLAAAALVGCALVAWAHLEVPNAVLWLIALVALAILAG